MGNPKLAILDELTTGLDPEARREIWSLIERMRDRGVTVILVTHFMDEAERLCDRLALINHGTVMALDTPEAIAARAGGSRVRFVPSQPVDEQTLRAIPGVNEIERKERYVTVTGTGDLAGSLINALAAIGVRVSEVEARTGNLEDAFIKLTKDDASSVEEGGSDMSWFTPGESTSHRSRVQFAELLKVQAKLALREPYGPSGGHWHSQPSCWRVFGFIGQANPGNVGDTGLTIIDVWTPTILVLSFIFISVSLPNTLVRDREIGWLRRVSTTPLHPSMLLAAQLVIDLVLAAAAVLIVILGGALVFGASLHVQILPFAVSLLLSIVEIFALGLVLVALVPTQTVAQPVAGVCYLRFDVPFGSVGQSGTGGRPLADDHVLLAERRGCEGCARFGLQRQPFICGAADHGRLHGHLRIHSDSLFPLGVARGATSLSR